jgi:formylglycine-generating enzyme required for sulfatase activity
VQDDPGERNVETKTRVFISYSRKNLAFADKLEVALKTRGFEVLIDRQEIYAFEDWWTRIEALIGSADAVVFVISPESVVSDVTVKEVAHADSLNKRFAPIVYRQVETSAVPEVLRRLNFIFFDDLSRFEASADKLTEALQTDIVWIRDHTKFGEAARGWTAAGRPNGLLLRTPALEMAEYWIASHPRDAPEPTDDIHKFVAASRQSALSGQRLRRTALGSIFTLMTAVIVGLVAWINQAYIAAQWRWWTVGRPYAKAQVWPHVLYGAREQALKPGNLFRECAKDCPEMVVVPAREFMMGSPATEEGHNDNEGPQHKVMVPKPFAVSKFDVTFIDWDACVSVGGCRPAGDNGFGRETRPVIFVSWDDAQQYVAWFSGMTGKPYRLLTEAEWEYAARAGSAAAYFWGDEIGKGNANCEGCDGQPDYQKTSPVDSFKPNAFGLHDMAGNVFQWVQDCYHDHYDGAPADGSAWTIGDCDNRVVRGGSWASIPRDVRSATRAAFASSGRYYRLGFRIARTLGP